LWLHIVKQYISGDIRLSTLRNIALALGKHLRCEWRSRISAQRRVDEAKSCLFRFYLRPEMPFKLANLWTLIFMIKADLTKKP